MSSDLTKLAGEYMGGLAHVHTRLSNYPGHFESNQTISEFINTLTKEGLVQAADAPFHYVLVTEHASNPARPRRLGNYSFRARALRRQSWHTTVLGVPVMYGFEASLLPDGGTDLTPQLAEICQIVVASRHYLPPEIQSDPAAVTRILEDACRDSAVDVIGHPAREFESVRSIDWEHIFGVAAATGTAVEVNLNTFPDPNTEPARLRFWLDWIGLLGSSEASVFIGTDLHNDFQLKRFIRGWRGLQDTNAGSNSLGACLEALKHSGILPERVVTATYGGLQKWLHIDKDARIQVLLP